MAQILNLNDRVRVQLSTMGIAQLWKHRAFLSVEERNGIASNGYVWTTQLWCLFQVFGGVQGLVLGEDTPFIRCQLELLESTESEASSFGAVPS